MRRLGIAPACALLLITACGDGAAPGAIDAGAGGQGAAACSKPPCVPRVAVARALAFQTETAGVSRGFDLDGRVSSDADTSSCGQADFTSPEGTPGIDNQFSVLANTLARIAGDAVQGLIRGAINDGTLLILLRLDGVDGLADDPCVDLTLVPGAGKPLVGTDGMVLSGQTFAADPATPASPVRCATLKDGVLQAGPFEALLPFQVLQVRGVLRIHDSRLRAELAEDGSMHALLGANIEVAQVSELAHTDGALVASNRELVDVLLASIADAAPDATGKCQQLSVAIELELARAFLFDE